MKGATNDSLPTSTPTTRLAELRHSHHNFVRLLLVGQSLTFEGLVQRPRSPPAPATRATSRGGGDLSIFGPRRRRQARWQQRRLGWNPRLTSLSLSPEAREIRVIISITSKMESLFQFELSYILSPFRLNTKGMYNGKEDNSLPPYHVEKA
jgi:hypothetical protein